MTPDPLTVPADLPVAALLDEPWAGRHSTYPVTAQGELAALVTARAATGLPVEERAVRRVADIMTQRAETRTVGADSELVDALETGRVGPDPR